MGGVGDRVDGGGVEGAEWVCWFGFRVRIVDLGCWRGLGWCIGTLDLGSERDCWGQSLSDCFSIGIM